MEHRDLNHVAIKIKEALEEAQPLLTDECCIYRVPHEIRKLNKDAYTPKVVSIGALHHGDKKLLKMEGQKKIYCREFIKRSETNLENLVSCVQELEPKVRPSYSDKLKLGEEEHVMVILVDCGFVFELLLRDHFDQWTHDDAISLSPWLRTDINLDLLLLENQLPFFVFEKLYNLAFASRLNSGLLPSFLMLTLDYIIPTNDGLNFSYTGRTAHFTDLLRTFQLQPSTIRRSREAKVTHLYSATELNEAGVKFKVNKTSRCILDLQFSGCTLTIPEIKVEDSTEILLRNMVALEQCHYPHKSYITDYVAILDFLINTGKDVDFLVKKGIIVNWLGDSDAVAELFNSLWQNITQTTFSTEYLRICEDLNAYCKHPWHRKVATLRRDYCNTPWKMAASFAGIALLVLTVIQTVCSILQVVQGSSRSK